VNIVSPDAVYQGREVVILLSFPPEFEDQIFEAEFDGSTHNPSTWKAEAGGLQIQGHPELHFEIFSQKTNQILVPHSELLG
jgi:hypothetical protein